MIYRIKLIHETAKLNRELTFEDYEIAEAHYFHLGKQLLDGSEIGNFSLTMVKDDNGKIKRLNLLEKSL